MASEAQAAASEAHDDHHHHGPAFLQHHFDTPVQQFDASKLGMWAFLAQEILFFSGLFVAYTIFRTWYPEAFSVGSHLLDWRLGGLNTVVLLFSSFTAAMAVRYAQLGETKKTGNMILITIVCACIFMVVKYFEYMHKIHVGLLPGKHFIPTAEGQEEIARAISHASQNGLHIPGDPYHLRSFFGIYFIMTGVHGLHVLIGIGVLIWMWIRNNRGEFGPRYFTPIDIVALYWHLVDLIWIYLFPLMYLID